MRPKIYSKVIVKRGEEEHEFKSISELSKALGISTAAIYQSMSRGKFEIRGWEIIPVKTEYELNI